MLIFLILDGDKPLWLIPVVLGCVAVLVIIIIVVIILQKKKENKVSSEDEDKSLTENGAGNGQMTPVE